MKQLFDDDVKERLQNLEQSFRLSTHKKEILRRSIFNNSKSKRQQSHRKRNYMPKLISIVVFFSIASMIYVLYQSDNPGIVNHITDTSTEEHLSKISSNENTPLIEWNNDSMDRGNHEFNTDIHGKLVIQPNFDELARGQVVYYHTPSIKTENEDASFPEMNIGRVIGLPGETVEIKNGQVYIDSQVLDTFYGKATMHGLDEEQYFSKVDSMKIENEQQTRDYFNMNMDSITVYEDTVFILVDQWWRGVDSRDFGTLSLDKIEGVIIGYQ